MKVTKVRIEKFRILENIDLPIGEKLTAIAGQNCTAKSTVLGLVGHVFTYDSKYKTIDNRTFTTKFSEIFKFSYPKYDKPKEHIYFLDLDDGRSVQVLSYDRIEAGKPRELRLRVGKSEKDSGKTAHPVIYLGLKRLFPLAQEKRVLQYKRSSLTREEVDEYNMLHNEILLLSDQVIPQRVVTRTKEFYGARTAQYDSLGNSAGQDNLGQLLTAIFSFRRLKQQLGSLYSGGLLLIDEIDAALYPAAQEKLIEKMLRISGDLDLQVICTSHSLETLSFLDQSKYRYHSQILYLSKASGRIEVSTKLGIQKIANDLRVQPPQLPYFKKTHVYCEDNEARHFLMKLLDTDTRRKVDVIASSLGANILIELANARVPEFKKSLIVLDGDQAKKLRKPKPFNVVILPGNDSPERVFHAYLKQLPENDRFWTGVGGYTRQVCFRDCPNLNDRKVMKDWYRCQLPYWGKAATKLINRWKEDHQADVRIFAKEFLKTYNKVTGKDISQNG